MNNKKALVILDGERPSEITLKKYWEMADFRICADGAAGICVDHNLAPDLILGDFDSITPDIKTFFSSCQFIHIPDQETTDGEKAIQYCRDNDFEEILILGALGKRSDHGLYNLGLLKKFKSCKQKIVLYSEEEEVFLIGEEHVFEEIPGTRISMMPIFGPVINVTTCGFLYPINSRDLELGVFSSISNEIKDRPASVSFSSGELLILKERLIEKLQ